MRIPPYLHVAVMWLGLVPIGSAVESPVLSTFGEHCVRCHGENGKVKGDVDLWSISSVEDLASDTELLQKIIEAIDFQEMPPEDEPQPSDEDRTRLLADLESLMSEALSTGPMHASTPIRRMNRFQYSNAVTDLFDLKCTVFPLPERMMREHRNYFQPASGKMADVVHVGSRPLGKSQLIENRLSGVAPFPQDLRAEHGYDNQADHLSLSPLLMEAFLKLSQSITQSPEFTARNVGVWPSFFAEPGQGVDLESEVSARIERFLTRAFREPVSPKVADRYLAFATHKLKAGEDYESTMKAVAAAVIASPKFLYLHDKLSNAKGDLELASRLSFFLWGSLPDGELLELAEAGRLSDPEVLEAQFERMLRDRKLKRFCDSFPAQWLQLDRIISSAPNPERFPDFYFAKFRASMHMMLEPLLIFETVLVENLPVTQLIDSDFTYRSEFLEQRYDELAIQPVAADATLKGHVTALTFERQPVTDRRNGGVITNAAVMTMTSGPDRTQPITRGAWIASVIFNNPPEPPPADVPPLDEKPTADEAHLTLRERLAAHRERTDCAGCHEKIDPFGFALENYDPVGRWRNLYENGREVDSGGKLFRQHGFSNPVEFKDALLAEKDRFTRALAGHLLSFALARELEPADQPVLDEIAAATAEDGYRFQTLLKQVIFSAPFRAKSMPPSIDSASTNR